MATAIDALVESVKQSVKKRRAVSEGELAIEVSTETGRLDQARQESLRKEFGEDLEEAVFTRLIGIVATASGALKKTEFQGDAFFSLCEDKLTAEDLEAAHKRLTLIRSFGKLEAVEDIMGAFLSKSGYSVMSRPSKADPRGRLDMRATKDKRGLNVIILGSIVFAGDCESIIDGEHEYVIAVPTEKTPEAFLRFCREKASRFEGKKVQVWVVDIEKKTVNPFLGYTRDDDIYRSFENPAVAALACRYYGVGKDLWVRPRL